MEKVRQNHYLCANMLTNHYDDTVSIHALKEARRNKNIRLGLCCINNQLRNPEKEPSAKKKPEPIFCSRGCIRETFSVSRAKEQAIQNVNDIFPMIEWNERNGIQHLRLSSEMFPHFTDTEVESYTIDFAIPYLKKAGELAKQYNHRITMHPGQFNQIGTPTREVFDKTIQDLEYQASILDAMEMDTSSILCIHGGGIYGDKENTMRRWVDQFDELPLRVKRRIAIENCEKCYSVSDCLQLAEDCNIPVIYDTHHFYCYHSHYQKEKTYTPIEELLPQIIETWDDRRPLFHISEQKEGKPIGTHSDMIENIPSHLLEIPYIYGKGIDIEVEAKSKEIAILYLMGKYKI